ncbi:hypothetical protein GCM10027160_33110 [Streptomyces calidiresistens]
MGAASRRPARADRPDGDPAGAGCTAGSSAPRPPRAPGDSSGRAPTPPPGPGPREAAVEEKPLKTVPRETTRAIFEKDPRRPPGAVSFASFRDSPLSASVSFSLFVTATPCAPERTEGFKR